MTPRIQGLRRFSFSVKLLLQIALWSAVGFAAILIGGFSAIAPAATSIKFSFLLCALLLLAAALVAGQRGAAAKHDGASVRICLYLWLFMLGACPAYLPFKFGPLPGLNPVRVLFFLVAGLWIYQVIASQSLRDRLQARIGANALPFWLLTAFLCWYLLSAALAESPVFGLMVWGRSAAWVLIFLAALTVLRDWKDVENALFAVCAGALVACCVGLIEWRTKSNPFLPFLPSDPEQLQAMAWIIVDKSRSGAYRVASTFSHPLALGEFLCMCLALAGTLAMTASRRWVRQFALLLIPSALIIIYATHTRSTLVAAGLVTLMFGAIVSIRAARNKAHLGRALAGWMMIVLAIVCSVVLLGAALELAQGRDAGERGSSLARIDMMNRGFAAVAERPLQGYGPGTAALVAGNYAGGTNLTIDSHYLSVLVESGVPGLALFLLAFFFILLSAARSSISSQGKASSTLIGVAVAIAASLTVKSVLSLANNFDFLYFLVAVVFIARYIDSSREDPEQLARFGNDQRTA